MITDGQVAQAVGVSTRTVRKWVARYRATGREGLIARRGRTASPGNSAPRSSDAWRSCARSGGAARADALGLPVSTVGDVLRRLGLGRLPPVEPRLPIVRYERATPGELLHIDAKRLGRIAPGVIGHRITGDRSVHGPPGHTGWECLHVAIDDASRVAYAELLPDESTASAIAFLQHAVTQLAALGVRVERVMTDNVFCYTRGAYAAALATLGIRQVRIRPYTPRTNGKADRFIQTALREWPMPNPAAPRRIALARCRAFSQRTTSRDPTPRITDDRQSAASARNNLSGSDS